MQPPGHTHPTGEGNKTQCVNDQAPLAESEDELQIVAHQTLNTTARHPTIISKAKGMYGKKLQLRYLNLNKIIQQIYEFKKLV
jgi:hypothetical protein